jgi:hypothetical protein
MYAKLRPFVVLSATTVEPCTIDTKLSGNCDQTTGKQASFSYSYSWICFNFISIPKVEVSA